MKMNISSTLFFFTLIIGTLITASSTSWLGLWMGLELNLMSFIPLMTQSSKFSAEAALKYFLTQAFASLVLLLAILLMKVNESYAPFESMTMINVMLMFAVLLKMGAAPTHFWFPEVASGLNWTQNIILMTWQKIAPFLILMYLKTTPLVLSASITLSAIVGALGGFNQTSLRKILAYSSINHMAWMLVGSMISLNIWVMYFLVYSFMTSAIMIFFLTNNLNSLSQMTCGVSCSALILLLMSLNMMSMGGLPPFLGFLPKWLIIEFMINNKMWLLAIIMIMMTLIVLYFYLRLTYSFFMFYWTSPTLTMKYSPQPMLNSALMWVSILGLITGPMLLIN